MGSRRAGFILDSRSMGMDRSRPPSPSPSPSRLPAASPECNNSQEQSGKQAEQLDSASNSKWDILTREGPSAVGASCHAQCNASTAPVTTDYFRCLLQKLRDASGEAAGMNFELNNIFLKRLEEIDCLDGQSGDAMYTSQLRLVTYQDWVDFLLHVNNMILGNMSDLEEEAYGKVVTCFQSVRGEQQQALDENRKLRKDFGSILKLVQTAYHHHIWEIEGLNLETLSLNQLLGLGRDQVRPESECEKMGECMKSLVTEMAAKHDEVCHLKAQINALEEVVQTARQKLLLKDQCIAQLNQQVQEITECFTNMTEHTPCEGPSMNATKDVHQDQPTLEASLSDTATVETISNDMLQNLSIQDNQESEMLRLLNTELNDLFDLHSKQEYQAMDCRRKRLSCFFEKLSFERDDTVRKLESIRSHLRILQSDLEQSCLNSEPDDPDTQIIEGVRRRLHSLEQKNRELHGKCQRSDTESKIKISELRAQIESDKSLSQRNSDILKEIADLICKLHPSAFSYNDAYDESSRENPFCIAIKEMFEQSAEKEHKQMACNEHLACQIQGLQANLQDRDNQIDQLQSMIKSYSDFSENNRLKAEIHELKQKNCDLSRQMRELAGLLKNQEEQRAELCSEYETMKTTFQTQCQELKGAKRKAESLQLRLDKMEELQLELRTERKVLREEVIALKEKEAMSAGRERALQEQQKSGHLEVEKMRHLIRGMQAHLQMEDAQHRESVLRLEEANESVREQMRGFASECQQMQMRLKQQAEVNEQQEQIIDSFRRWKDAQVRADEAMRQCAKRAEEHIRMLLDENQTLAEEYRTLFRDHTLLETEMQRVKQAVNYASSSSMGCPPQASGGRMNPEAGNDMT
ncbi:early endosome antigen 1 isoform X2 [Drosophila gunungcola]|uniref:early endosome antigen 1 isoform X2 n=1 Tax=Drosophila gunungcola TaxID=103775 RepID=UPI0022E01213|nr:early endosome antigen 1 isoform X2 [Drosophila gunungcola]